MMIGKTISHYQILEKLGGGGMGVVYKARDLKLDRLVALKFLSPHFSMDDEGKQRFIQEAKAASALDHPNICTIHEIDETRPAPGEPGEGQLFIVMAYYEGEILKEKLNPVVGAVGAQHAVPLKHPHPPLISYNTPPIGGLPHLWRKYLHSTIK